MRVGWYILLYHDVSWEHGAYVRGLGATCPPDLFDEHVRSVAQLGQIMSVPAALDLFESGKLDRPVFSFWFDDGMRCVREYAAPILREVGVTGVTSICSRFASHTEMFWRVKLSFLSSVHGLRSLRPRLNALGYQSPQSIREFSMDKFSPALLAEVDAAFEELTTPADRADAFRLFDTPAELKAMHAEGWTIANHTASHLPVSEDTAIEFFQSQFEECESYLNRELNLRSQFWVAPFDRPGHRSSRLFATFKAVGDSRHLVLVGDQINVLGKNPPSVLYRIAMPIQPGRQAIRYLKRAGQVA